MSETKQTFGGRYAVIERVGVGGMAEVYRARDELLGRDVAVKVLHDRFARDRAFVERFKREAQVAANLNHPNIVSLYDYGSDAGTYYIVMEFIEGRSLAEIIAESGPLLPERAAEIGTDVARGLERAHAAGLVHRDVKAGNVMMTTTGQTKVTDFGIVRAIGTDGEQTMTQAGMIVGTASYLSPEQAQGNPIDARSDIYSLGVVLYEMLTGRPPFTGETPLAIAYKHVRENALPPSSVNPDVPKALDAITMKALAKNPDNRFPSAAEMRADLERFLSGETVRATPLLGGDTIVERAPAGATAVMRTTEYVPPPPPPGRGTGFYVLIALIILALFAGLALLLFNQQLGNEVSVPRVVGLTEEEARAELQDEGFRVRSETAPSRKPIGQVIRQDPAPDETAEEGSTVLLTVSSGPKQVEIPDLTDLTQREANQALKDAGLKLGDVSTQSSETEEEGDVISQFPEAGQQITVGSEIDIVVSSGPPTINVPSVIGFSEADAITTIRRAGLVPEVERGPADDADPGEVASQDPEANTQAQPGDTVRIFVSEGPSEIQMPNVMGQDADAAAAALERDYGLIVEQVGSSEPCAQPPGTVCSQDPGPGTPVSEGDSATLFVQEEDIGAVRTKGLLMVGLLGLLGGAPKARRRRFSSLQ